MNHAVKGFPLPVLHEFAAAELTSQTRPHHLFSLSHLSLILFPVQAIRKLAPLLKIFAALLSVAGTASKVLGVNLEDAADGASSVCKQLDRWNEDLLKTVDGYIDKDETAQLIEDASKDLPKAFSGKELAELLSEVPEEARRSMGDAGFIAGLHR